MGRYLFTGSRIYTGVGRQPFCQAMAVIGDKVLKTGTRAEVEQVVDDSFERIDTRGRLVIPAFTDSHVHFKVFSLAISSVDLEGTKTPAQAAERVSKAAAEAKPGTWILGGGWNKNEWPGGQFPDKAVLDSVAPRNPVALASKDLHTIWVNSMALSIAGITKDTPDPEGGEIMKDGEDGLPNGILKEAAVYLVRRVMPKETPEIVARSMEKAMAVMHSYGIASIHNFEDASALEAFQALKREGKLKLRVVAAIAKHELDYAIGLGLRSGFGDSWLRIGSLKLFADGALGPQTAYLLKPYEGNPRNTGIPVTSKEEMAECVGKAVLSGIACAIHAIGDKANRDVLDILESVKEETAKHGLRHRIEHAQLLHPDDVRRFGSLGIIASMQPVHILSDIPTADKHWGRRSRWAYAFRTLTRTGASLCFGSDAPVETPDTMKGMYAAVARRKLDGQPERGWYMEEHLTVEETIRAYTAGAAWAAGDEAYRGTLAQGMAADIAVLSKDIFTSEPEAILDTKVLGTMVGGDFVYRNGI